MATQNFRVKNGLEVGIGATILFTDSSGNIGIGTTDPTKALHVVGDTFVTGVVTATTFVGDVTGDVTGVIGGVASTATALENARDFSITGDFVTASAVSFDGTGNVALAATIAPDSVGLGTYTSGDYVQSITGTSNEIEITGGTGEGSTPTIGLPNDVTIGNDLTVTRDLQVTRNLNVDGNITVGGTTATIIAQTLEVGDADLILGVRTDANGNDVSTDNTANHGGIAIASTEGTPLVTIVNPGAGETLPSTYKKIMWFKTGSFSGLGTDAWLANYAVGIGSTQVPYGTRLSAGNVQITNDDISVVRDIDASGIITASSFEGDGSSLTSVNATTLDSIDSTSFLRSDAADTKTGITTFSDTTVFDGDVELNGNITTNVTIVSTDAGSSAAPEFKLYRNSASPADADYLGQIKFAGESDTGVERNYAKITGKIGDATNGTEDGIIEIAHIKDGSQNISARWNSTELQLLNGTHLSLGDSQEIRIGDGNDLEIFHSGSASVIRDTGAGNLYLQSDSAGIILQKGTGSENLARFLTDGAVELYYDNSKKFETTGYGVTVSGGLNVSGVSTFQGNAFFGDNDIIYLGDGNDLRIYHSGGQSYIQDTGTGNLNLLGDASVVIGNQLNTETLAKFNVDGSAELYYDNSKKFETTGYGVTVSGGLNVSGVSTFQSDVVASSTLTVGDATGISGGVPTDEGVLAVYTSGGKNALIVQTSDNTLSRGIAFRNSADAYIGYISMENRGSNLGDMVFGVSDATESSVNSVEERLRITKDGDVGIGTDSPTAKLDVRGTLNVTGIATATSFVGDLTGDVTGNADTATNIAGGDAGDIPYQSAADTTTFVDASSATNGQVLLWNGSAPVWDNVTAASGAFGGITVQDEGSTVGTANSIKTIDFVGSNIVATATAGANGISTVTLSDTPTFDSLTVTGDVSIADKIVHTGDTDTAIRFPANNTLTIETNGSEKIRVTSGGLVGIGTDNPSDLLNVYSPNQARVVIEGSGSATSAASLTLQSNTPSSNFRGHGVFYYDAHSDVEWFSGRPYSGSDAFSIHRQTSVTAPGDTTANKSNLLFIIDSAGLVGIGTDDPQKKLHVYGEVMSGGNQPGGYLLNLNPSASGPILEFGDLTDTDKFMSLGAYSGTNNLGIANRDFKISSSSVTNLVYIADDTGNVGIGTDNPTQKLDVYGGSAYVRNIGGSSFIEVGAGQNSNQYAYIDFIGDTTYADYGLRLIRNNAGANTNSDLVHRGTGGLYLTAQDAGFISLRTQNTDRIIINSTGYVGINSTSPTATLDVDGTLNVTGVSTFQGNVDLGDNDRLRFGAGNDLQIYHNGSNSVIQDTGTGSLILGGSNSVEIRNGAVNETAAKFITDGAVELYYDNSKKFETTGYGVTVSGGLNVSGVSTFQDKVHLLDNDKLHFGGAAGDDGDLQIYHDGTDDIISSGGATLKISGSRIVINNAANNENQAVFTENGSVELYYDNSKKLETTGIGVSIVNGTSDTATITGPTNLVIDPAAVGDNTGLVRIKGDLYVDGTTTQINSTTLELADFIVGIATTATTDTLADGAGIQIGPDNTFLYEYNSGTNPSLKSSENLNVASGKVYQIDQTERLSADTLSVGTGATVHSPGSNILTLGTNGEERVRVTSAGNVGIGITNPGAKLEIYSNADDTKLLRFNMPRVWSFMQEGTGSGTKLELNSETNGKEFRITGAGRDSFLRVATYDSSNLSSGRVFLCPEGGLVGIGTDDPTAKLDVDGTLNVSGVSTFQDKVHLLDNDTLHFGGASGDDGDLQIYHDGSNSYIKEDGTGSLIINASQLFIKDQFDNETHATFNSNGKVELYYDNSKKFETTGYGVTVTGGVHVSGVVTATSFESTVSTGTAPFVVASTTKVTNLNADLLDGKSTANGASGNTVVIRNAAGGFDASDVNFANITASGGLNVTGISTFQDKVHLLDDDKLHFGGAAGDDGDLQIYHDGSNSYIDEQGTGDLILRGASDIKLMHPSSGETYAIFNANGASELYYDNSKKFETTGYGVTVTGGVHVSGVVTATSFEGDGSALTGISAGTTPTENTTNQSQYIPFYVGTSSTDVAGISSATLVFNPSTNRMGVGTDSPQATLHVVDDFILSTAGAASSQRITQRAYTTDNGTISWEADAGQLFSITNNLTSGSIFSVNDVSGIPSIDVDADGTIQLAPLGSTEYVGVGTTAPIAKLHVVGDINVTGVVTATDFNSTSDARLKTNVQVIEDPLEKVQQINGVSFNWIKDNKPSMGVIADNIQEVMPELVTDSDPKTVNYNGLIGLLIEVVKDQQTQINSLNERLSRLE